MPKTAKPPVIDAELVDSLPQELQDSEEKIDSILDDFESPTEVKTKGHPYTFHNDAWKYYQTIQPQLEEWWREWSETLDEKNGGPKYRTVGQFARSRSKDRREQNWIESMIGPEPALSLYKGPSKSKDRWLKVPWLGDWRKRRSNGYWAPEEPGKIKALTRSIKDKLQGFEAVQSSAPYLVQMMARYMRLGEQVDQVFGGQALDLNSGPTDKNKSRFYTYLEMQKAVTRVQLRLLHEWWTAHGLSTNGNPVMITQVNQMFQNAGISPAGMADSMSQKDLEAVKLAKMLSMHADNFNMPLPDQPQVHKKESEKPTTKGNGKVM